MTTTRSVRQPLPIICILLSATSVARAQFHQFWIGPDGGSFTVPENWSGSFVPGPNSAAVFNTVGGTIMLDGVGETQELQVWNTQVIFNAVFKYDYLVTSEVNLAPESGQNAHLTMLIGHIESEFVYVGDCGTGTLTVLNSASVEGDEVIIGDDVGSHGSLVIQGTDADLFVGSFLLVGGEGVGELTISSATISACFGTTGIGLDTEFGVGSGVMTVTGPGTQWFNLGWMHVGWFSPGTLNIEDGGLVNAATSVIGNLSGTVGVANVDGPGSTWDNLSELFVGRMGSGSLSITNGGSVFNSTAVIGAFSGSTGTALVDFPGSTWASVFDLSVGAFGAGTLTVSNGGTVLAPVITVGETGEINGDGFLDGDVVNNGVVSPGSTARVLTVLGDYQQTPTGRLDIELGLTGNDVLDVNGQATLGGVLNVSFTEGDEPLVGVPITVLNAGSIVGTFDDVNCTSQFQLSYDVGSVTVTVMDTQPVDCDVVHWTAEFGGSFDETANWLEGVRPGVFSTVVFDTVTAKNPPGFYSVFFFTNAVTDRLIMRSDRIVQLELLGRDYDVHGVFEPTEPSIVIGELPGVSPRLTVQNTAGGFHGLFGTTTSIGHGPGSSGELLVTGAFTLFGSEDLSVGREGDGMFSVEGGASATTFGDVSIATGPGVAGDVRLIDTGTRWVTTGSEFFVGESGDGSLEISGGAQLLSNTMQVILAVDPGSTALVKVTGQGSKWLEQNAAMFIGGEGEATVVVENGGTIQFPTPPTAGIGVDTNGRLMGDGFVVGNVLNVGEIIPGQGDATGTTGVLTIDGNYEQVDVPPGGQVEDSGILTIDLAGTTPGTGHDQLVVTGESRLGGGLFVTVPDTFVPQPQDSFVFLQSTTINAGFPAFDVAFMPGLGGDRFMRVAYGGAVAGPGGASIVVDTLASLFGFGNPVSGNVPGTATGVVVGDFDNLNGVDLAISLADTDPKTPGSVLVLLNAGTDGSGNWLGFAGTTQRSVGNELTGITAGFFNADAALDVAVSNRDGNNVFVLLNSNDGSGSFGAPTEVLVGAQPSALAAADFDGNATVDLVVADAGDGTLHFLDNNGAGVFVTGSVVAVGLGPWAIDPSDVDDDKDVDAVVVNRDSNTISVVENLGGGSFAVAATLDVGTAPVDLAVRDLDGNGFADFVTANNGDGTVSVVLNNGGGTFAPAVNLPVGDLPRSLTVIDLEGDLDQDIAVVANNALGARTVQVLRNDLSNGQLIFAPAAELAEGENPVLVTVGDLDEDGAEDLVTVNEDLAGAAGTSMAGPGLGGSANVRLNTHTPCPWDCGSDNDSIVGIVDFLALLAQWGGPGTCDFDGGGVGITDFLELLGHWGPCP